MGIVLGRGSVMREFVTPIQAKRLVTEKARRIAFIQSPMLHLLIIGIFAGLVCAAVSPSQAAFAASQKAANNITTTAPKLTITTQSVKHGKHARLKAVITTASGKKSKASKVKWHGSNARVASVSASGAIVGHKMGQLTVTATMRKGLKAKKTIYIDPNSHYRAKRIPVLTYHRVFPPTWKRNSDLCITARKFEWQMRWLKEHGYRTLTTSQYYQWYKGKRRLGENCVLLTIDDGRYETYYMAYPILKKYGFHATAFIIGINTGKKTPAFNEHSSKSRYLGLDVINNKKVRRTIDFQSHTYNLHWYKPPWRLAPNIVSYKRIVKDFRKNRKFGFRFVAYPYGANSANIMAAARNEPTIKMAFGYRSVGIWYSTRSDDRWNISRMKIKGQISKNRFRKIMLQY